jgi:hypothetical protein
MNLQSKPEAKMKFAITPILLLGCLTSFCVVLPSCTVLPAAPLLAAPGGSNEAKAAAAPSRNAPPAALQQLDSDHDGTVDLEEAKAAAAAAFDRLDSDHDGTLDRRELRGRLNAAQFAAADPDNDGTLDAKELRSPAGRDLLRLVM